MEPTLLILQCTATNGDDLLKPLAVICPVRHADDEAEALGGAVAVLADVVFGDAAYWRTKWAMSPGAKMYVAWPTAGTSTTIARSSSKMYSHAEQVHPPRALAELLVVERVVVRLPGDLGHVEVAGNPEVAADAVEFPPLDGFALQPLSHALQLRRSTARSGGTPFWLSPPAR